MASFVTVNAIVNDDVIAVLSFLFRQGEGICQKYSLLLRIHTIVVEEEEVYFLHYFHTNVNNNHRNVLMRLWYGIVQYHITFTLCPDLHALSCRVLLRLLWSHYSNAYDIITKEKRNYFLAHTLGVAEYLTNLPYAPEI